MSWAKLDDSFYDHPKFAQVSLLACWLWVRCLGYAARHLTDGFVPFAIVEQLTRRPGNPKKLGDELVTARLWEPAEGGYQFHDYAVYNPSAEGTRARRAEVSEIKRKAGKIGAAKRWGSSKGDGTAIAAGRQSAISSAIPSANGSALAVAWQTNSPVPVPVPKEEAATSGRANSKPDEADRIEAELRRHPVFAPLDVHRIAKTHAGRMMTDSQRIDDVLEAIAKCAAKVQGLGLTPEALQSKLVGFLWHAGKFGAGRRDPHPAHVEVAAAPAEVEEEFDLQKYLAKVRAEKDAERRPPRRKP